MEDINKKNETFIRDLMNKGSFILDWYEGAILPKQHPQYYDGRIEVHIRTAFNNYHGEANFGKDSYQVSDEGFNKLRDYVEANIVKLVGISLNQTTEMYDGVSEKLFIKYDSVCVDICEVNASSEEETATIRGIKKDIKDIILNNSKSS